MIHPAQRICASDGILYYAISNGVYSYALSTGSIVTLWEAGPLTEQEKAKNIEHRAISEITTYKDFLVWIGEDKVLRVYSLKEQRLLSEREFAKRGCALSIADDLIVVGDKFGDVYIFPLIEERIVEPPVDDVPEKLPILGHVSMLTAVTLTHTSNKDSQRYIITADRDEHIRVSNFPDGHNIQAYCLGHAQFLSSLLIPAKHPEVLISAGGDEYMIFWDWKHGKVLEKRQLTEPSEAAQKANIGLAVLKIVDLLEQDSFFMLAEGLPDLFIFSVDQSVTDTKCITLPFPALDIAVDGNDLWISYDTSSGTDASPLFGHFHISELFINDKDKKCAPTDLAKLNEASRMTVESMGYTVHKYDLMRKRTKTELEAIRLANPANKQKELTKKRGSRKNGRSIEAEIGSDKFDTNDDNDEDAIDHSEQEQAPNKKLKNTDD